jgi:hypothetical protein
MKLSRFNATQKMRHISDFMFYSDTYNDVVGVVGSPGGGISNPGDIGLPGVLQSLLLQSRFAALPARGVDLGPFDAAADLQGVNAFSGYLPNHSGQKKITTTHVAFDVPHEADVNEELRGGAGYTDTLQFMFASGSEQTHMDAPVGVRVQCFAGSNDKLLWVEDAVPQLLAVLGNQPGLFRADLDVEVSETVLGWGPGIRVGLMDLESGVREYAYIIGSDGPGWAMRVTVYSQVELHHDAVALGYDILDSCVVDLREAAYDYGQAVDLSLVR